MGSSSGWYIKHFKEVYTAYYGREISFLTNYVKYSFCIFISGLKFVAITIKIKMTFFLILIVIVTNFNPEMTIQILDCNIESKKWNLSSIIWCVYFLNTFWISAWWWHHGIETCNWLNHYFIRTCFYSLSLYFLLIFQHNGMHNFMYE